MYEDPSKVGDHQDRDVTQLGDIQKRSELHRLLRLVADGMAQPLVTSRLGSALRLADATTTRYLSLFEEVFLLKQLPAWSASATSRASRAPKLLMVDTGLAAHLSGRTEARINRDDALAGPVIENFVLSEIARQIPWSGQRSWLGHFRTRDGIEVDGVLEAPDGRIVGIEVKAARSVNSDDFRGLRYHNLELTTIVADSVTAIRRQRSLMPSSPGRRGAVRPSPTVESRQRRRRRAGWRRGRS